MAIQDHFFPNNNMNYNINNNNNNLFYNEFDFNVQQQQYLAHLQNMQKRNFVYSQPSKRYKLTNNETTTTTTTGSTTTSEIDNQRFMNVSQSFAFEVERQRHEIDRFINLQNERLKLVLQEQNKQQLIATIKKLEAKALELLKQKDDEIANATKKSIELQQIMTKLQVENQAWQKISLENETIIISLNNTLSQLQQQQEVCSSSSSSNSIDDEDDENGSKKRKKKISENEEIEISTGENRGFYFPRNACQNCHSRNACVLMLPCRHLGCCKVCDGVVHVCPLCNSTKMASIEVLLS